MDGDEEMRDVLIKKSDTGLRANTPADQAQDSNSTGNDQYQDLNTVSDWMFNVFEAQNMDGNPLVDQPLSAQSGSIGEQDDYEQTGDLLTSADADFPNAQCILRKKDMSYKKPRQTSAERERQLARDMLLKQGNKEMLALILKQDEVKAEEAVPTHPDAIQTASDSLSPMAPCGPQTDNSGESAEFAEARKTYENKKMVGKITLVDQITFAKAQEAERERAERLENERRWEGTEDDEEYNQADNNSLFVRDDEYSDTRDANSDYDGENEHINRETKSQTTTRAKASASKRKIAPALRLSEKDMKESLEAGIPEPKATKRRKRNAEASHGDEEASATQKKKVPRAKAPKKQKQPDQAGQENTKKRSRRSRTKKVSAGEGYVPSLQSMVPPAIITASNGRVNVEGSLPEFTAPQKKRALAQLLKNVPDEAKEMARVDAKALDNATKQLNHPRRCTPAPPDRWKLKGMQSTLKNFQLLGLARMREFEKRTNQMRGGIIADYMGLGKTVSMLANMVDGAPEKKDELRATLIVVPPAILGQWMREIQQHLDPDTFPTVLIYSYDTIYALRDPVVQLAQCDIVLTTYNVLRDSYPKYRPPLALTEQERLVWWRKTYTEERGPLHRINWRRIVLDECQSIKTPTSQVAIAAQALMGKHRWLMSGTPLENKIDELYAYGKFLKAPFTGTFECYKNNYLKNKDAVKRLHEYVKTIMIRRTYDDELFGQPIEVLPAKEQETKRVNFSDLERQFYNVARKRSSETIQNYVNAKAPNGRILWWAVVRMNLLRQITGHFLSCTTTLARYLTKGDLPGLWTVYDMCPASESDGTKAKLKEKIREIDRKVHEYSIADSNNPDVDPTVSTDPKRSHAHWQGHVRKEEIPKDHCVECGERPTDAWVTQCNHFMCSECLDKLEFDGAANEPYQIYCPAKDCGKLVQASRVADLGAEDVDELPTPEDDETAPRKKKIMSLDPDLVYLSTKMREIKEVISTWMQETPNVKVVVFTQFLNVAGIIDSLCRDQGWKSIMYNGAMSRKSREKAISSFQVSSGSRVLVASFKAGGVGLNLTTATRAILVDLYWNAALEQQAFSRIYRIGQQHETKFCRIAIKETVDDKLISLQERKSLDITHVLNGSGERLTVKEMLSLFEDSDFIIPNEDLHEMPPEED